MNSFFCSLFITAAPLVLIGTAALISEHTGTLAIFIDGLINAGAFCAVLFTIKTNSPTAGILFAIIICTLLVFLLSLFTIHTKSNPFLIGLGINFLSTGCISLLSRYIFNTTSIIPLPAMMGSKTIYSSGVLLATIGWTISIVVLAILQKTSWGIHIRITGRDPEVLEDRGLNPHHYKHASWSIAAALATIAGCIYVFNLSAFVPNISSGRGWVALTAVFVGRKKGWGTILVLLVFAITDYIATAIQGIATVHIPPTIFLSVPYIAALILFVFQPKKSTRMY